jgi:hypothetical protein
MSPMGQLAIESKMEEEGRSIEATPLAEVCGLLDTAKLHTLRYHILR